MGGTTSYLKNLLSQDNNAFLPSISVDCVIFGFYDGTLKILLNKFKFFDQWMLPGGFVLKDQDIDNAASEILLERTGLNNIYLKQFHLFGDASRTNRQVNKEILKQNDIDYDESHWLLQRFISLGYFAFINYSNAKIRAKQDEEIRWFDIDKIPLLYSDHNLIISKAISTIRQQINNIPIGKELLPEKFTVTELRTIYETILNRKLDRRNFQKKMLTNGIINKLDEVSRKNGIKPTFLYSFNEEKYNQAQNEDAILFEF